MSWQAALFTWAEHLSLCLGLDFRVDRFARFQSVALVAVDGLNRWVLWQHVLAQSDVQQFMARLTDAIFARGAYGLCGGGQSIARKAGALRIYTSLL